MTDNAGDRSVTDVLEDPESFAAAVAALFPPETRLLPPWEGWETTLGRLRARGRGRVRARRPGDRWAESWNLFRCAGCDGLGLSRRSDARWCSPACRQRAYRRRSSASSPPVTPDYQVTTRNEGVGRDG